MRTHAARACVLGSILQVVAVACGVGPLPTLVGEDGGTQSDASELRPQERLAGEAEALRTGLYPAGPLPPPVMSWSDPAQCPDAGAGAHCSACWEWNDGGAYSLGRAVGDDHFGNGLAVADFNGDGYPDLAAGASGEDAGVLVDTGLVYLFLGSSRGFQPWLVLDDLQGGGPYDDSQFGRYLHASDINGDGRAELFIGYGRWLTNTPIHVFEGAEDGVYHLATFRLSDLDPGGSTQSSSSLGSAWASGDFDHDGDVDIAVGAPRFTGGGRVYVLANDGGGGLSLDYELSGATRFGTSLAVTESDELVVGSSAAGEVRVYDDGVLGTTYLSATSMDSFGTSVATGDLDGDAVDEILVGGFKESYLEVAGTGGAMIASGSALAPYVVRPLGVADLDDDGYNDVVLVHEVDFAIDLVYDNVLQLVEGNGTTTPTTSFEITGGSGQEAEDVLGDAGAISDIDGDGRPDLVVGAPGHSTVPSGGRVYAYAPSSGSGWDASIAPTQTVHQETGLDGSCDECAVYAHPDGTLCGNDGGDDELCVSETCVVRGCGDGYRQPVDDGAWLREGCDDGNTLSGDACSGTCTPDLLVVASGALTADAPSRLPPSAAADGRDHVAFVYVHDDGESRTLEARTFSWGGVAEQEVTPLTLATLPGVGWDAHASVAGLASGGWVAVWTDPDVDGAGSGIAYRLIRPDGSLGPVRIANEDTGGEQLEPRVAGLSTGFVMTWTDASGFDGPLGRSLIEARRFDDVGTPLEGEWALSDPEVTSSQPALACAGDACVAVWTRAPADPFADTATLRARRFDAATLDASLELSSDGFEPSASVLDSSLIAVAFTSRADDHAGDIRAVVIDPFSGMVLATELLVATGDEPQGASSLAALGSGDGFSVAYETGGRRRGLAWANSVGASHPSAEWNVLEAYLTGHLEGDVTLLRTSRGLWFAWSDAGDVSTDAYRSFLAFLLPLD